MVRHRLREAHAGSGMTTYDLDRFIKACACNRPRGRGTASGRNAAIGCGSSFLLRRAGGVHGAASRPPTRATRYLEHPVLGGCANAPAVAVEGRPLNIILGGLMREVPLLHDIVQSSTRGWVLFNDALDRLWRRARPQDSCTG